MLDRRYDQDGLACRFISGLKASIRTRINRIETLSEAIADAERIVEAWKEIQEERKESRKQYAQKKYKNSFKSQKKNSGLANKPKKS